MVNLMQGPVPGQSLTDAPKNSPWEKPAELNEVEDIVELYVKKLSSKDVMDDLAVLFELGADLKTTTEVMTMAGSMKGLHTVEAGMLANPVISSYLNVALQMYGIEAPETNVNEEEVANINEKRRMKLLMDHAAELAKDDEEDDEGIELLNSMQEALTDEDGMEEAPEEEAAIPPEPEPVMEDNQLPVVEDEMSLPAMAPEQEQEMPAMGLGARRGVA
jgi:hypothetical protein